MATLTLHDSMAEALRGRVLQMLEADAAVCDGKVAPATAAMIGDMAALGATSPLQAIAMGRKHERADILAYLAGRKRAAETIAAKDPDQAERARGFAQQIAVQIEAIEQGLHEGDAAKCEQVAE